MKLKTIVHKDVTKLNMQEIKDLQQHAFHHIRCCAKLVRSLGEYGLDLYDMAFHPQPDEVAEKALRNENLMREKRFSSVIPRCLEGDIEKKALENEGLIHERQFSNTEVRCVDLDPIPEAILLDEVNEKLMILRLFYGRELLNKVQDESPQLMEKYGKKGVYIDCWPHALETGEERVFGTFLRLI